MMLPDPPTAPARRTRSQGGVCVLRKVTTLDGTRMLHVLTTR
jgi:hypothetical protein